MTGPVGGFHGWRARFGEVEVLFAGRGPRLGRQAALRRVLPTGVEPSWLEQVHSATVVDARTGVNGPGDALVTGRRALALAVVTADCVPVLLADDDRRIAAVHAGWRGLARSILPAALARLGPPVTAWIGPAIGACCYEVGTEVAGQVAAASSGTVVRPGRDERPHLDLVAAARIQLERCGVEDVRVVDACTRCDEARLFSYRREGPGAGRNVAAIWRRHADSPGSSRG